MELSPRTLIGDIVVVVAMLPALAADGAFATTATGGTVRLVEHGLLTHPADRGTWKMTGAITDSGTFVDVCVKCSSGPADLRGTFKGTKGSFVLFTRARPPRGTWTLLSGTGLYEGLHGKGTCVGKLIVNEVSFRAVCTGVITR